MPPGWDKRADRTGTVDPNQEQLNKQPKVYPLFLDIGTRLCVVVGGGRVAERKVQSLLSAGGQVRVVSPQLTPVLAAWAEHGAIEWRAKPYAALDLQSAFLVFAATNDPVVQSQVLSDARAAGVLINVADAPDLCDFHVPANLRRGDLTLAIATNGKSPAVAAMIRRRLATMIGPEYGLLTALAAELRCQLQARGTDSEQASRLFQQILDDDMLALLKDQRWSEIRRRLEQILGYPITLDPESLIKEMP